MQKQVKVTAKDGGVFDAAVYFPSTDLPAPAIVVIQEIFGVNANMRSVCNDLAQAGYIAICPDLFWRLQPGIVLDDRVESDMQKAFGYFKDFNVEQGVEDLIATLDFIRADKECTGKVGALGYCLGGKLAYLMAARSNADCSVSFYGVGLETMLDEASSIQKPLMIHIAGKDKYVPLDAQAKILSALNDHKYVETHVYPEVDHAFARINGAHYDKEAAHQANYRTADFLATYLTKKKK